MFFLNVRVVLKLLLNILSPSSVQSITYYLFLPGTRYTHYHHCHWHSVGDMVFTAWQWRKTRVCRVLLMGQMYSDEDVRGLFSFLSKAGNGKKCSQEKSRSAWCRRPLPWRQELPDADKRAMHISEYTCTQSFWSARVWVHLCRYW